ncbi:MAG: Tetratricopeptide 1 repeat-containing protein [Crocinitomicaceae bacterium]|jgi:tetratricopeptide (TPR) repeat protein|nr:Tetratricopeptide 1 repeat-containing protein [Crocinitomicaceae bacterium]
MKNVTLLFTTFTLFTTLSFSQTVSETRRLFYGTDKDRLKHAEILRDFYLDESPDSIYAIGSFLIKTGIRQENLAYLNYGKHIISRFYFEHGKAEISLQNLGECMVYYERKGDPKNLADAQNMTGLAYMYRLGEKEAIHWFRKSLETARELPEESEAYMAQFNMAEAFYRLEDYDSAEKELLSYFDKVKRNKLNKGLRRAYDLLGKICMASGREKEGLKYYLKSVDLAWQNGDKLGLSFAHNNLAIAYFQLDKPDKAREAFEKSLHLRKAINKPAQVCESYFNLGEYYYSVENYPQAIAYYDSCTYLAEQNNLLVEQADALGRIGECYRKSKNFEQACVYLERHAAVQQQVLSQSKKDAHTLVEDLQDFQPGEQQLRQNMRERKLQQRIATAEFNSKLMLGLTLGFCLFFAWVLWKQKRKADDAANTQKNI